MSIVKVIFRNRNFYNIQKNSLVLYIKKVRFNEI